jgi:predicted aspartyl protease
LKLVNKVQMIRMLGRNSDLVPVGVNGVAKNFLLDTGGLITQIQKSVAEDLKLPVRIGSISLTDVAGRETRTQAFVKQFSIGYMKGSNVNFPIQTIAEALGTIDGLLALDFMLGNDIEVDFGSDTLNFFSPDHCDGAVVYWQAPAVAVVPFTVNTNHIYLPVTLEGHEIKALIDTGATTSFLRDETAQRVFGLSLGSADTPEMGTLNDTALKTYRHIFKSLAFEGVSSHNAPVIIAKGKVPDADMLVGMDVLRHLHLYIAFKERKIYISQASEFTPEEKALQISLQPQAIAKAAYAKYAQANLKAAEQKIATDPQNAMALTDRCYMRAVLKSDLDAALADCDQALKLKPGTDRILDSRAFVLYQQEKYQDAIAAYDQALAVNPKFSESLFMRGFAKGKLGDEAGKTADIAAANQINPTVENEFRGYDISF